MAGTGCSLVRGPICIGVDADACAGVASMAVGNLAWNASDFVGPATVSHAACPAQADEWALDAPCWSVSLPLGSGTTPVVIMGLGRDGHVGQVGGDCVSGQLVCDLP